MQCQSSMAVLLRSPVAKGGTITVNNTVRHILSEGEESAGVPGMALNTPSATEMSPTADFNMPSLWKQQR